MSHPIHPTFPIIKLIYDLGWSYMRCICFEVCNEAHYDLQVAVWKDGPWFTLDEIVYRDYTDHRDTDTVSEGG